MFNFSRETLMQRSWATFTKTPNLAKYTKENIKMEVINFKTKHEINQTVYIVDNGIILETKVKGVLFTESPYQYKLLGKDGGIFFVYEEDVSDSIEQAIEKAVLQHKEKLQREYFPPKATAPDTWGKAVSELEERYKPEKSKI